MRIWAVVVAVVVIGAEAHAGGPVSPRLAALAVRVAAKQRGAEDAFWKQVADEGAPLVEDTRDPEGRLLVTFVYRAKPDTRAVALYSAPGGIYSYARLERLAGTDVFAYSALVAPSARFSYVLAPGDDLGPPGGGREDIDRSVPLFRPDPLNKHPYHTRSLVEPPKAPPQPLLVPHRATATGELTRFRVRSKALGNERDILVYTGGARLRRRVPGVRWCARLGVLARHDRRRADRTAGRPVRRRGQAAGVAGQGHRARGRPGTADDPGVGPAHGDPRWR
jgi:hypothetical protein